MIWFGQDRKPRPVSIRVSIPAEPIERGRTSLHAESVVDGTGGAGSGRIGRDAHAECDSFCETLAVGRHFRRNRGRFPVIQCGVRLATL